MILLVEDNPHDVLLTRRAFRKAGLDVPISALEDGDRAIAYLDGRGDFADRAAHPWPGLVLLDLKLPGRGGLEVLRWIRAQPHLDPMPVVVLTSSAEEEDVVQAYRAGANSYLRKPVSLDELTGLVAALHAYWMRTNIGAVPAAPHPGADATAA